MDSATERIQGNIYLVLTQKVSKLPRLRASTTWRAVYDKICSYLKEFSEYECDDYQEGDSEIDDFLSSFAQLDLGIANSVKQRFNDEIIKVVNSMTMTEKEVESVFKKITNDLDVALKQRGFVENKWCAYGSYANELSCIDSDIDLYYENIRHSALMKPKPKNIPTSISSCLKKNPSVFSEVNCIINARVPIIKLKHRSTGKECDISFCEIGVKSSMLTKFYIQLYPNVKYLTLYLKLILKKCNLYGTNRMTTHVIFWLVVFFLQQEKISLLPPVRDVRKKYVQCKETDLFDNWNCSLKKSFTNPCDPKSDNCLLTLLLGFAKFYRDFDFTKFVISPYLARVIPIEDLENWQIPVEILPLEFQKNNSDGKNTFIRHVINLQDPSILSSNAAKSVECKIVNIFKLVCNALMLLIKNKETSLLNNTLFENFPSEIPHLRMLPRDLKQCSLIKLNWHGCKVDPEHVFRAVHKVMSVALSFELKKKTWQEISQVVRNKRSAKLKEVTVPIVYMSYSSSSKTWSNANVRKILLYPNARGDQKSGFGRLVNVFLICEVDSLQGGARILIQSEIYLLRFLHKYGPRMFDHAIFV